MIPKGTIVHVSVEPDGPYVRFMRGGREFVPDDHELPTLIERAVRFRPDGELAVLASELGPAVVQLTRIHQVVGATLQSELLQPTPRPKRRHLRRFGRG